jgi:hypothetical protein
MVLSFTFKLLLSIVNSLAFLLLIFLWSGLLQVLSCWSPAIRTTTAAAVQIRSNLHFLCRSVGTVAHVCFSIYALGHPGVAYHRVALAEMIPLPLKWFIACILYFSICLWHMYVYGTLWTQTGVDYGWNSFSDGNALLCSASKKMLESLSFPWTGCIMVKD